MNSTCLLKRLEQHPRFIQANTVLLYHSLPDEVYTHDFIEQWSKYKNIILPVIVGNDLKLYRYTDNNDLVKGDYGVLEPTKEPFTNLKDIDLAIIPGVAFDYLGNRLGRGKGYYDRLLPHLSSYNIGICFDFQMQENPLPHEAFDRPMDEVIFE